MTVARVSDRAWIRARLLADPALHLYELGDLDDAFWPRTRWYARGDAIALIYDAPGLPVLSALGTPASHGELLAELAPELPPRLHAHLSPGLAQGLAPRFASERRGEHAKLALTDSPAIARADTTGVLALGPGDRDELLRFYTRAYPGNWFDPRMLELAPCAAIRERGELVAAGGVHVYSAAERVAALGNIAVAPEARGRGLGRAVTAALCLRLRDTAPLIGLNVRADNAAAIACYTRLGFTHVARYEEHVLVSR